MEIIVYNKTRMNNWIQIFWLVLILVLNGCAKHQGTALYAPPSLLPHTIMQMKTAGFWISRHPNPDTVILSLEDIENFNRRVRQEFHLTKDLWLF